MHANDEKATGFVRMAHIEELLEHFSHNTYSPKGGDVKVGNQNSDLEIEKKI